MRRNAAWMLPFALACSFDSTWEESDGLSNGGSGPLTSVSQGTGTGTSAGSGSTGDEATDGAATVGGTAAVDASSGDMSTGPVLTTEPDDTTTTDGTTTGGTTMMPPDPTTMTTMPPMTTEPETTMPDPPGPCAEPIVKIELLVEDAELTYPMVEMLSGNGEGIYASSEFDGLGWLKFSVTVPCADDYQVWGRVYDAEPGAYDNDPDTFYAHLGDDPEILWGYGCQTAGYNPGWTWQRMIATPGGSCADLDNVWVLPLAAGTHDIEFRNREGQDGGGNRAAIAKIWVTNDPNFIPP
jgi:hypothetical protein